MMDKRSVLAIALSGVVLIVWQMFFMPKPEELQNKQNTAPSVVEDTLKHTETESVATDNSSQPILTSDKEYIITVKNHKTTRILSTSRGVHFKEYFVNNFKDLEQKDKPTLSIVNERQNNQFFPTLKLNDGREIDFKYLTFTPTDTTLSEVEVNEDNPEVTLEFVATIEDLPVYQKYTFVNEVYDYTVSYDFSAIKHLVRDEKATFSWINGMPYTEDVVYDDKNMSLTFVQGADDFERHDLNGLFSDDKEKVITDSEYIKFISTRTKYFMNAVIPHTKNIKQVRSVENGTQMKSDVEVLNYNFSFETSLSDAAFTIYVGPYDKFELDNERYEDAELSNVFLNSSGYENFFNFFSKPLHLIFIWLNSLIGNLGVSILIFTLLIKIVLFPLTKKSYQGMKQMQEFQPRMAKLKEKYGDNPQEMQKQMMKIYQQEGINPLGGCLPMLLQMPLIMALFHVFRSAIEFRGAEFLWIENLAAPDALPIGLGAIGFATINILPILMAVSQIGMTKLQSGAAASADPNQKMMQYIMPVMFLFMFYQWSAALNFYYLLFNVFTVAQQKLIHTPKKEDVKKEEATPKGTKLNEKSTKLDLASKNKKQMYKKKD
mgnify:CR=1 FL=1